MASLLRPPFFATFRQPCLSERWRWALVLLPGVIFGLPIVASAIAMMYAPSVLARPWPQLLSAAPVRLIQDIAGGSPLLFIDVLPLRAPLLELSPHRFISLAAPVVLIVNITWPWFLVLLNTFFPWLLAGESDAGQRLFLRVVQIFLASSHSDVSPLNSAIQADVTDAGPEPDYKGGPPSEEGRERKHLNDS